MLELPPSTLPRGMNKARLLSSFCGLDQLVRRERNSVIRGTYVVLKAQSASVLYFTLDQDIDQEVQRHNALEVLRPSAGYLSPGVLLIVASCLDQQHGHIRILR